MPLLSVPCRTVNNLLTGGILAEEKSDEKRRVIPGDSASMRIAAHFSARTALPLAKPSGIMQVFKMFLKFSFLSYF